MYSKDFREKVLSVMKNEGLSVRITAKRFKMSKTTLMKWKHGIVPKTTRNKSTISVNMDALKRDIEEYPDAYQYERAERLGCGRGGIYHALKRLGVTYKKNTQASQGGSRKTICLQQKHS
jgi:transposase